MQKIIFATFFLFLQLLPIEAMATVRSCILDGGGSVAERVCNVEEAVGEIRTLYQNMGIRSDTAILSGPGRAGAMACTTPMYGCTNPDVPSTCTPTALNSETWDASLARYVPVAPTARVSLELRPSRGEHLYGGDAQAFHDRCLFDSDSPPASPIPVCHFWNLNHGAPEGSLFYREESAPQAYMSNDLLREKANHCQTFRFVTHTCHGGQLSQLIYDENRRVIPGRCGVSAMPPGYTAPGYNSISTGDAASGLDVTSTRFTRTTGRAVSSNGTGWPAETHYPLIESLASASSNSRGGSLDFLMRGVSASSALDSDGNVPPHTLQRLQPYATSDFFLADQLGNLMTATNEAQSEMTVPLEAQRLEVIDRATTGMGAIEALVNRCYLSDRNNAVLTDILTLAQVSILQLSDQTLTDEEKTRAERDLRGELDRFVYSQQILCMAVDGERPLEGIDLEHASQAEVVGAVLQRSLDFAGAISRCNAEESYEQFRRERAQKLARYQTLRTEAQALNARAASICANISQTRVSPTYIRGSYRLPSESCTAGNVDNYVEQAMLHSMRGGICNDDMVLIRPQPGVAYDIDRILGGCRNPGPRYNQLRNLLLLRNEFLGVKTQATAKQQELDQFTGQFEQWLGEKNHYRRYEDAKMRFSQVLKLYKDGSREQVQDYLNLRDCETAPMDGNVVSN
jgi:hypothetical protein